MRILMMYVSFLLPVATILPKDALLWVMYKQLFHLQNKIVFCGSEECKKSYLEKVTLPVEILYKLEFINPNFENEINFIEIDREIVNLLYNYYDERDGSFAIATKRINFYERYLLDFIQTLKQQFNIKAIINWNYNKTLKTVCDILKIKLIHNEIGPLRKPFYRQTAYFDFSGIHFTQESDIYNRFRNFKEFFNRSQLLTPQEIRDFFQKKDFEKIGEYDIGVVCGYESPFKQEPINKMIFKYIKSNKVGKILVRPFPGAHLYENCDNYEIDDYRNTIEFIKSVKTIVTYNSNLGAEALLYEKNIVVLGNPPYKFYTGLTKDDKLYFLNFFFFSYLIPYELLFDDEYYTFRFENTNEKDIYDFHLKTYKKNYDSFLGYENLDYKQICIMLDEFIVDEYYNKEKKRTTSFQKKIFLLENQITLLKKELTNISNLRKFSSLAIFGLGKSGKMTYEFIKKYYPEKIKYFIDDNVKGEYEGIPIVTTKEFLEKYQNEVDIVVFGKYQHLNQKLLTNLRINYLKLENIL